MEHLPKAINCRLGDEDMDLKVMLSKTEDKTARVKTLLRKGLEYEYHGMTENEAVEAKRRKAFNLAIPREPATPLLYIK